MCAAGLIREAMCPFGFTHAMMKSSRHSSARRRGFTLAETVVAMGVCSIALSVFYVAVAQGLRIVKNATEQAAASQLLEQRIEALRARPFWGNVITTSGVKAVLAMELPTTSGLAQVSESCTVGSYPGDVVAFTVTRQPDGTVSVTGSSLPVSQTSVRITEFVSWGASPQGLRTRSVSTVFTKGGL
jgi:type II secretory pathway pseudopilin PulG